MLSQASQLGTAEESVGLVQLPSTGRDVLIGQPDIAGEWHGHCVC